MLFNEKIDYLIKLGFKTNSNFKTEFKKMLRAIPIFARGKLLKAKEAEHFTINCGLSYYVNNQKNGIATDVELEIEKTKLFKQDDETDFAFTAELPYTKDIEDMPVDTIDDVEQKPNGMVIWELMSFECNDEIVKKEFEFDFIKTNDGYYLVCEESVGDGMLIDSSDIIGYNKYKLTDEDLKFITIDGEKQYENEISD